MCSLVHSGHFDLSLNIHLAKINYSIRYCEITFALWGDEPVIWSYSILLIHQSCQTFFAIVNIKFEQTGSRCIIRANHGHKLNTQDEKPQHHHISKWTLKLVKGEHVKHTSTRRYLWCFMVASGLNCLTLNWGSTYDEPVFWSFLIILVCLAWILWSFPYLFASRHLPSYVLRRAPIVSRNLNLV